MKVIIRTDSSQKIGLGHVMRCLTLSEELRSIGVKVEFITRNHMGNISEYIKNKGFKVHLLVNSYSNQQQSLIGYEKWLSVKQNIDADETIKIVKDKEVDWLIVDHYAIDDHWEEKLRPYTRKIMVIDDLANRKHDCDLLLDQNYIHDKGRYNHLITDDTVKLLGLKYVLLRKEFTKNKISFIQRNKIERIFVFFGGADLGNLTTVAIKSIIKLKLKFKLNKLLVDVVVGSANPYQLELKKEIEKHSSIKLHIQVDNISELMSKADLALGAGGIATWERMVLGVPSIVVTIAENQVISIKELDEDGYINWLGNADQVEEQTIDTALHKAINNSNQLQEQSRKCQALFDGKGAEIVSNLLINGVELDTLSIRKATSLDILLYWHWVNDPVVRKNSFNENTKEWKKHQEWFNNSLNSPDTILLLIESSFGPIGQVRFDQTGSYYAIDYSLAKQFRGFGLAKVVLSMAIEYLSQKGSTLTLTGEVKKSNIK